MRAATATTDSPVRRPKTVDELTENNVRAMQRMECAANVQRGTMDRIADRISAFGSTSHFVWMHAIGFAVWLGWNTVPGLTHFDPYPFTFLTLVVSLEAIFLSSFILISQNRAATVSERRNQLDLQINLLTEQENTKMLRLLQRIADKFDVEDEDDPSLHVLEQAMRPEKLAEQIAEAAREQPN